MCCINQAIGIQEIISIITTVSSVIASIVAIIISINTSKKQNKISLFEERYSLYKDAENFFRNAYNYYKKGDIWSISPKEMAVLEYNFDIQTEKSKFVFDEEIQSTLVTAKELFREHIVLFKESENPNAEHIKKEIRECQMKFEKQMEKYLKIK